MIKDNGSNVTAEEHMVIDEALQTGGSNADVEIIVIETESSTTDFKEESDGHRYKVLCGDGDEIEEQKNLIQKNISHA